MKLILYLALGGLAGTFARYSLQGLAQPSGATFPLGTLVVNLLGALLLGFLMRYLLATGLVGPEARAGLTIGFCGAFTTMSTFSYETMALLTDGQYWRAALYLLGSVGGSLAAIVAGMGIADRML
ncbi:MAG TPA: fluoride efflux transporter CrcB [Gemmatimonadales bacterium]|jgi:CrcB protein|nr:fluoride efflux transporter CrcB [Gemmatimonadales bacterium]